MDAIDAIDAYRFRRLERFTREDVAILNRAVEFFAGFDELKKMFQSLSEVFQAYDICVMEDVEINLVVKPLGETGTPQFLHFLQSNIGLGRVSENEIPLKSPLVSKKHAEIIRRGVDYYLKDLESNNGTLLNQVKLTPGAEIILKNDDVIRIEPYEIVVGLSYEAAKRPLSISCSEVRICREIKSTGQVCVFFKVQPAQQSGAFLLERQAARWMVQKIITGQNVNLVSPWSEIESGLLEYLVCKALSTINPHLRNSRLLLQSVEMDDTVFQDWFAKNPRLVEMTLRTDSEIGMIYGFLYLPELLVGSIAHKGDVRAFLSRAEWLRNLQYTFSIHLGVSLLSPEQVSLLEEGDIILLDRSEIALEQGNPKGKIEIKCGQFQRGVIRGSLACDGKGNSTITVESVYQEGLKRMTEASKKTEGSQTNPEEGVIAGIEVPVTVEFARLSFTLDEISSLKEGQIVEMEKAQPELVDLSVDGKTVANGKLVDVEGKLGVRILKIVKGR